MAVFLTISTSHRPATDLGYLLHKHPDRVQRFPQSFGTAVVFYPEATQERCTAALLLDVDPIRLVRTRGRHSPDFSLSHYINDRPYAASSLLAVALGDVFGTARAGRCAARPDLVGVGIPLEIGVPVLPCRGGPEVAHRIFAPLGWEVSAIPIPLYQAFPQWGDARYVRLALSGRMRLADALNQLYVLLPALDESKHYWQGPDEVDKLLRSGSGWLETHPERDLIAGRYLGRHRALTRVALARLAELGDDVDSALDPPAEEDATVPARVPLNAQRHAAVLGVLREVGASSVIDLGCGTGQFVAALLAAGGLTRIAGCDVSTRSLQAAARHLHLDTMSERQAGRLDLFQSALTYADDRIAGFDAAVLMEVIEHVDPSRLGALESVVFGSAAPGAVVVTTPNREYNPRYPGLTGMRHPDHRFEWDRAEFAEWASRVAATYGYAVDHRGIGDPDPEVGTPTQMAVFTRD